MITSKDNERLKLIRKLGERKHRDRERMFAAEGEDLVEAAAAAGWEPEFVLRAGEDVEPELLDAVSALGSGTRVIGVYRQRLGTAASTAPAIYLHGVGDPANVGAIVRSAHALAGGCVVIGPGTADPFSPKAVRASMGSVFAQPLVRAGVDATPSPRAALVAHGGAPAPEQADAATVCLGGERAGLPRRGARGLRLDLDDPAAPGRAREPRRRRGGGDRSRAAIVGAARGRSRRTVNTIERIESLRAEASAAIAAAAEAPGLEELRVKYLGRKSELTTILQGDRRPRSGRARRRRQGGERGSQGARVRARGAGLGARIRGARKGAERGLDRHHAARDRTRSRPAISIC